MPRERFSAATDSLISARMVRAVAWPSRSSADNGSLHGSCRLRRGGQGSEDAIHESAGFGRAVSLRHLDRLVDRCAGRHLWQVENLVGGEAHDIAVDRCLALERPRIGESSQAAVYLRCALRDAVY